MAEIPKDAQNGVKPKPDDRKLSPDDRAAGRARVAQLLGQLVYRRWQEEQQLNKDQKPKPK